MGSAYRTERARLADAHAAAQQKLRDLTAELSTYHQQTLIRLYTPAHCAVCYTVCAHLTHLWRHRSFSAPCYGMPAVVPRLLLTHTFPVPEPSSKASRALLARPMFRVRVLKLEPSMTRNPTDPLLLPVLAVTVLLLVVWNRKP